MSQRLLVLLLEFDNMPLLRDAAHYNNKYFNTSPGAISVVNFFSDMAGGRNVFIPAGAVSVNGTFNTSLASGNNWATAGVDITLSSSHSGIVHARMGMNHPITSWNAPSGHEATRDLVSLVLSAINDNSDFNFAGVQVAAVIAGGEASDGGYNPGGQTWAHAWQFQGSVIGQAGWPRYMAYGERLRGGNVIGIGTAVHELGHVLGLPDLYDVTGQSEGIGPYSVMGLGNWGGVDGLMTSRPSALDPWSRMQLGFITPTAVSGDWTGNINSLNNANSNVIKVTHPSNANQFFLIENRQFSNVWDVGIAMWNRNANAAGGIMVYHVDNSMRSDNPGDPTRNNNNRNHQMVGVREADGGNLMLTSVAPWGTTQDHFFSAGSFATFAPDSSPNSNFFGGGGRNVATGITIVVNSARGDVMEVSITR
jgi:M6 family metalloprotease-like protein